MELIADCGATKAHYVILGADAAAEPRHIRTAGFTPLTCRGGMLPDDVVKALDGLSPDRIVHYGAGCADTRLCGELARMYRDVTGCPRIQVYSDMLGAARAMAGGAPAIVGILGTGSNSCLYDGQEITDNVPAMGYVLGDEGSGAALGRRLLGDIFKRQLPPVVGERLAKETELTYDAIVRRVYCEPQPARYLAAFTHFIHRNLDIPALRGLVVDEFARYIRRNILNYSDARGLPLHLVGSVAWYFEPQLREAASDNGITVGRISRDPVDGLITYHRNHHD